MPVSLWCKDDSKYPDSTQFESETTLIVKYSGQTSKRRDHLISEGNYFFKKEINGWKYKGIVIYVSSIRNNNVRENVNIYELVIKKGNDIPHFKTKNEACEYFGWIKLNNFERTHGIILNNIK